MNKAPIVFEIARNSPIVPKYAAYFLPSFPIIFVAKLLSVSTTISAVFCNPFGTIFSFLVDKTAHNVIIAITIQDITTTFVIGISIPGIVNNVTT